MIDLSTLTIKKAREMLEANLCTAEDLVKASLALIDEKNPIFNAFLGLYENAIKDAKAFDDLPVEEKSKKPLGGIPIAIKDNILIKGEVATGASKILQGYKATYDATVVKKLKEAGAIFIGRANMDEFAMGGSTENSAYAVTKNPYDQSRVAGGSSGGSAAAVSLNMVLGALGSDTGGSIRQPANYCGVVGLKPTYGSVSRYGLMSMASSLDVIGPIAKNVEDAEIIFDVIKGKDVMDSTTSEGERISKKDGKVIGVPASFLENGIDGDVKEIFEKAVEKYKSLGYTIEKIELPILKFALGAYYIIMPAEVSSNLARYDGIRFGPQLEGENLIQTYLKTRGELFGKEARRRIILGTYVLSSGYYDAYYKKACLVRDAIRTSFNKVFEKVDIILMPVTPTAAFKIGQNSTDPLKMYLEDIFTVGANLGGVPAVSIPAGTVIRDGKSLPVGIQLMAGHFGEKVLFEAGKKFETI